MLDGTLVTFKQFTVGQHGLDTWRRFGLNIEDPDDYIMIIEAPVLAETTLTFSIKANLPDIPYQDNFWRFKAYRVLPQRDIDGEILDAGPVPYPWINVVEGSSELASTQREIVLYASNDGVFNGFALVGQIPFTISPSRQTPGADIQLTVNFGLSAQVQAKLNLVLDITAPPGFIFKDACFKVGSPQFSKCTGYKNTASLVTVKKTLSGTDIPVHLAVKNPGETPTNNKWTLALFKDQETSYVNWSEKQGYKIAAMKVSYKGNNQLQSTSTGYFTFEPMVQSPSPVVYLYFYPPADAGYKLECELVQPLAFKAVASCQAFGRDEPLELKLDNASLAASMKYTIGIGVQNPGGRPPPSLNLWGLLLKDHLKQTFDGNLRIQGLDLKSVPINLELMGWLTAQPRSLSTIAIQMLVKYTMQPGLVKTIEIVAPKGIMYNENPNTVKVTPLPLPLDGATPTQVMGDVLKFNLDLNEAIKAYRYNVRFEVSNPSEYPNDNTWTFRVMKDIEVEFSHVFAGYVEEQDSPFEVVTAAMSAIGSAQRHADVGGWLTIGLCATASFLMTQA